MKKSDLQLALAVQSLFHEFTLNLGLQHLVDKAREILGHPLNIHDTSYKLLAYSYDANAIIDFIKDESGDSYINPVTIQTLKDANIAEQLREKKQASYFKKQRPHHGTFVSIIKINDIEVAQLVVYEAGTPFEELDFALIESLSRILSSELQKNNAFLVTENSASNYILADLLSGKIITEEEAQTKLHYLPWIHAQSLRIITLSSLENKQIISKIPFMLQSMKAFIPNNSMIIHENELVAFIPDSLHDMLFKKENSDFTSFLKSNRLCLGVSLPFSDISLSKKYYLQASTALNYASSLKQSITFFEDCRLRLIFDFISEKYQLEDFYHPAVILLQNYDAQHGTNLLKTLKYYLFYTNSPNKAAKTLSVHRNTLLYRINKIKDLTAITLDEADESTHIYTSIKLLEMNGVKPL